MLISVILPTHNPDPCRFARTLEGLKKQTANEADWDLVVVDNASALRVNIPDANFLRRRVRIIREDKIGLTYARLAGVAGSSGDLIVFVDDDNVLAPNFLEETAQAFARLPQIGALGGRSLPEFETSPQKWVHEFFPLLALRDLGETEQILPAGEKQEGPVSYPSFAPIGAGLTVRRQALADWLKTSTSSLPDRVGTALSSGGDNEIVFSVLKAGWGIAYVPQLLLTHLIPDARQEAGYLKRLNFGIQKSWMHVLTRHGTNPWPPLSPRGIALRKFKAWFTYRAWQDDAAAIRWRGACGHFEGRAK